MSFTTESYPGVHEATVPQAQGFTFNHTMLRVKDPERSLDFYTRVMGMRVLRRLDFEEARFSLYFLAKTEDVEAIPEDEGERMAWAFSQRGILELTHNWGTEKESGQHYHNGNDEPQGFGHICFAVPDLEAAVAWFDENGVQYVKRPEDGRMPHIAFIKDPDGYWIEILQPGRLKGLGRG
ncbi:lactoylglutathione lyase [Ectothiorhodospiraceae bacterium WFHF3C12]|nr:lactoylglutathione lyase [Ectothiorhodospiraceae bacterium WFHF3C12]